LMEELTMRSLKYLNAQLELLDQEYFGRDNLY
jgi:hypothetical protein